MNPENTQCCSCGGSGEHETDPDCVCETCDGEGYIKPIPAQKDQVIQMADGYIYVAAVEHQIPEGARILQGAPHQEGTEAAGFHYSCNWAHCRCHQ